MTIKPLTYSNINSTAIDKLTIDGNNLKIVFTSSTKDYSYSINNTEFVELLDKTITNGESVGRFINNSLKEKNIEEIKVKTK
jgi:hypothetical protein